MAKQSQPAFGKVYLDIFSWGQSLEAHKEIERYAKKHDCKIIDLWDEKTTSPVMQESKNF